MLAMRGMLAMRRMLAMRGIAAIRVLSGGLLVLALTMAATASCAAVGAPSGQADIAGVVTALDVTRGTMLIEEDPSQTYGSDKASVTVVANTRFYAKAAGALSSAALGDVRVGQRVEAWFDGPVAESYPVQAKARAIVIVR